MLDTIDDKLSEDMIKKFQFILKDGTLTDSEKEWFNVGEYKKNFVGNITTSLPSNVASDMKELLGWYDKIDKKQLKILLNFMLDFRKFVLFKMETAILVE